MTDINELADIKAEWLCEPPEKYTEDDMNLTEDAESLYQIALTKDKDVAIPQMANALKDIVRENLEEVVNEIAKGGKH